MILIRIGYIILDMIDVMTCAKTSEFCFFFFFGNFFSDTKFELVIFM